MKTGMAQRTICKQVYRPCFLLTLLFPLPLVGGELEGRWEPLRTFIKIGFKKYKPTDPVCTYHINEFFIIETFIFRV